MRLHTINTLLSYYYCSANAFLILCPSVLKIIILTLCNLHRIFRLTHCTYDRKPILYNHSTPPHLPMCFSSTPISLSLCFTPFTQPRYISQPMPRFVIRCFIFPLNPTYSLNHTNITNRMRLQPTKTHLYTSTPYASSHRGSTHKPLLLNHSFPNFTAFLREQLPHPRPFLRTRIYTLLNILLVTIPSLLIHNATPTLLVQLCLQIRRILRLLHHIQLSPRLSLPDQPPASLIIRLHLRRPRHLLFVFTFSVGP